MNLPRPFLLPALTVLILLLASSYLRPASAQDDGLSFHAPPRPLAADAVTEPWPRFLGPHDNATSNESPLLDSFPDTGPPLVWERERGTGYASPAIAGGRLVLFHRVGDRETVECLDPETGRRQWLRDYPVEYRDRYGYSNGPRAGPVIDGPRVFTFGVTHILQCLEIATGKIIWKRDLKIDFDIAQGFFGAGPSPLVVDDMLILNLGAKGASIVALEKSTGKTLWTAADEWGASYASPVAATLRGEKRVLVFAGGESDPAIGGLLVVNPADGSIDDRFPWRADKYESVNASTPVVVDDRHVFISECYEKGGVMLEVTGEKKLQVAWMAPDFGMHWMTPVLHDGFLYGFRGRNEPDAFLACYDAADGAEKWRETGKLAWKQEFDGNRFGWGFFRGSILHADGKFIALGELGTLAIFDLTPQGMTVTCKADLFRARSTWTLPALHRGLLYVSQNEPDLTGDGGRRLLCYDLRP